MIWYELIWYDMSWFDMIWSDIISYLGRLYSYLIEWGSSDII